jgi:hypothetical protein
VNHRRRVVKPGGIRTGALTLSWDKSERNLSTALAVPGMKVARSWLGLCNGTGELLGSIWAPSIEVGVHRETGKRQIREPQSTGYGPGGRNVS